jgi:hypothetical protein
MDGLRYKMADIKEKVSYVAASKQALHKYNNGATGTEKKMGAEDRNINAYLVRVSTDEHSLCNP